MGEEKEVVPCMEIWIHVTLKDTFFGYDDLRGSLLHCEGNNNQSMSELIKHERA